MSRAVVSSVVMSRAVGSRAVVSRAVVSRAVMSSVVMRRAQGVLPGTGKSSLAFPAAGTLSPYGERNPAGQKP